MIDATDATFAEVAIERSRTVPVVVDLWAEWCGPCRTLGPILERVVDETAGQVELVKVDVDSNPQIATAFRAQSIPAVHALVDGKVVDSFLGALPEAQVRAFVQALLPTQSEADRLLEKGDLVSLFAAHQLEPAREDVAVALARELIEQRRADEALRVLAAFPEVGDVGHLAARARLLVAGVDLGQGTDDRLEALLARAKEDDVARQELVDLLDALGPEDPRTARYRRALASRLF
ncbi:MAG TPA: tetratricopeptide repeat protein [Acidimicrobiales bacterium]|nr:tetratricopeptide repeat protein [Acidimicrobiales bacterium]